MHEFSKPIHNVITMTTINSKLRIALAIAAAAIPIKVLAATVGTPLTAAPMGGGTLSNSCILTATPGTLGFSLDKLTISTDSTQLGAGYTGTAAAATIAAATNMYSGTGPNIIMDAPVLTGDTAATSLVKITGGTAGAYAASDTLAITSSGQIVSTPINIKFTKGTAFDLGAYSSVATITCTDDGTKT